MFAVIFEVQPKRERWDEYLGLARLLRPEIEKIEGFIENERYASKRTEGRLLSLSLWRDEKALIRWRTFALHHQVQEKGRFEVFEDYHLRVGEITADTAKDGPLAQQRLDETETGRAKCVTISTLRPEPGAADLAALLGLPRAGTQGLVDQEVFESIYNPGDYVLLAGWADAASAAAWAPRDAPRCDPRHRTVRIIRDYGMADRREAPQYFPDVTR